MKEHETTRYSKQRDTKVRLGFSRFLVVFFTAVLFCIFFGNFSYACPGCRDLVKFGEDAAHTMRFGKGIAWSMAVFFAVPVLLIGGAAFGIYHHQRKYAKDSKSAGTP